MTLLGIIASQNYPRITLPPVAGYKVWLDASDTSTITEASNAVSAWTDKSVNAYVFEQTTATNKPTTNTRTLNSKNVIDFDGTNDFLKSTATASTWNFFHNATGSTAFVVLSQDTAVAAGLLITSNGSTQVGIWNYNSVATGANEQNIVILRGQNNVYVAWQRATGNTYASATPVVLAFRTDPSDATLNDRADLFKNNNTDIGSDTGETKGTFVTSDAAHTLHIASFVGSDFFNGVIGEILIYDSQLTGTNITDTMDYLKTKWGI